MAKHRNPHIGGQQVPMFTPESRWVTPTTLPDLRGRVRTIAIDTETKDEGLIADAGPAWFRRGGYVAGVGVAWEEGDGASSVRSMYLPIRHPDSECLDKQRVADWITDHVRAGCRFVTQNGVYDWGWLSEDLGVPIPDGELIDEIGAAATIVDENRLTYNLDDLCAWRGLPGKDERALREALNAYGYPSTGDKVKANLYRLPARYVGEYGEGDPAQTLLLLRDLEKVIDEEGTRAAYQLECQLLPMVLEMKRVGVRIDTDAAVRARQELLAARDATFRELGDKLVSELGWPTRNVSMAEIGRTKWLEQTFDRAGINYPRTPTGLGSFTAGSTGWMHKHKHWLPQLIVRADKANNAAEKFIAGYILGYAHRGRIHAETHPHRSDDGGTRSLRFSYSHPPLQQMTSRDDVLTPLIRGCFLPEVGEKWAAIDYSQQEYRLIVHYAALSGCRGAQEAVEAYHRDPNTDFHNYVVEITGLDRRQAKDTNFAKAFGAGVPKFASMINKSKEEAEEIYNTYDGKLPFVSELYDKCQKLAQRRGYITLLDGARRHWTDWEPSWLSAEERGRGWGLKQKMNPCPRDEALARTTDPEHAWYGKRLIRHDARKAMNALIQGGAARQTKMAMVTCYREGILPMIQMHDELDLSVGEQARAERAAEIMRDVVKLEVPVKTDVEYGINWADAKHTNWDEVAA